MIVAKLNDVLNSIPILKELSDKQMPATLAFKLMKIIKSTEAHFIDFNKTKMDLVDQYGMRDNNNELMVDKDKNIIFSKDEKELYLQELKDILDEDVDIVAQPLTLDDLKSLNLSPIDLMKIDCFIEQKKDPS